MIVPRPNLLPNVMDECLDNFEKAQRDEFEYVPSEEAFLTFCRALCISHTQTRKHREKLLSAAEAAEEAKAKAKAAKSTAIAGESASELQLRGKQRNK